jgi:hypothetical protein
MYIDMYMAGSQASLLRKVLKQQWSHQNLWHQKRHKTGDKSEKNVSLHSLLSDKRDSRFIVGNFFVGLSASDPCEFISLMKVLGPFLWQRDHMPVKKCPKNCLTSRVARWYLFKPKKNQIWVNFGGPWNGSNLAIWNTLRPFGTFVPNC